MLSRVKIPKDKWKFCFWPYKGRNMTQRKKTKRENYHMIYEICLWKLQIEELKSQILSWLKVHAKMCVNFFILFFAER